jgi:hypothetical protein
MFKWLKKKLRPEPKPQLSALGAEIMEAMQNPDEWTADDFVIHHKKSGLDLWVTNRCEKFDFFRIYRLPAYVIPHDPLAKMPGETELRKLLTTEDVQLLAPVAYALHDKITGTLVDTTLNALRLARQTTEI